MKPLEGLAPSDAAFSPHSRCVNQSLGIGRNDCACTHPFNCINRVMRGSRKDVLRPVPIPNAYDREAQLFHQYFRHTLAILWHPKAPPSAVEVYIQWPCLFSLWMVRERTHRCAVARGNLNFGFVVPGPVRESHNTSCDQLSDLLIERLTQFDSR